MKAWYVKGKEKGLMCLGILLKRENEMRLSCRGEQRPDYVDPHKPEGVQTLFQMKLLQGFQERINICDTKRVHLKQQQQHSNRKDK